VTEKVKEEESLGRKEKMGITEAKINKQLKQNI
jgi:hypothetical protein